jgi:hypothetical protein
LSISEISRRLNISRLTVRKRLREGWNINQLTKFYSQNKRLNRKEEIDISATIQRIEQQTGENFIYTVKKILQWSNKAEDIATALGLTAEEFKACSKVLTANEILKIKKD